MLMLVNTHLIIVKIYYIHPWNWLLTKKNLEKSSNVKLRETIGLECLDSYQNKWWSYKITDIFIQIFLLSQNILHPPIWLLYYVTISLYKLQTLIKYVRTTNFWRSCLKISNWASTIWKNCFGKVKANSQSQRKGSLDSLQLFFLLIQQLKQNHKQKS